MISPSTTTDPISIFHTPDIMNNQLRYPIGSKAFFINVDYTRTNDAPSFGPVYVPWLDKLKKITIIELTSKEHHRVANSHDLDAIRNHDGFVFEREGDKTQWHNQFPNATYGQVTDHHDWTVRPNITFAERTFQYGSSTEFEDVRRYIERIARCQRRLKEQKAPQFEVNKLNLFRIEIEKMLRENHGIIAQQSHYIDNGVETDVIVVDLIAV